MTRGDGVGVVMQHESMMGCGGAEVIAADVTGRGARGAAPVTVPRRLSSYFASVFGRGTSFHCGTSTGSPIRMIFRANCWASCSR